MTHLAGRRILVGVTGSIASIRTVDLVRLLRREGAEVRVVMTESATRLLTPTLFEHLTGRPVLVDLFKNSQPIPHVALGQEADLLAVVPATAATMARMAAGLAEDALSCLYLAMKGPVMVAPAMNPAMWSHPATQRAVQRLREDGVEVVSPVWGEVACGPPGEGRLAPVDDIFLAIERLVTKERPLEGFNVLVTAGPTREPLDAVRFISNPSTGRMGMAMAREAYRLGASVRMIVGPGVPDPPAAFSFQKVSTVNEMETVLKEWFPWSRILVMTAAVGDYQPAKQVEGKRKKGSEWSLSLVPTADLLSGVSPDKGDRLVIGFAAEVSEGKTSGQKKMIDKGMDMVVVNDVSSPDSGFGATTNKAAVIDSRGGVLDLPLMTKKELAGRIFERLLEVYPVGG